MEHDLKYGDINNFVALQNKNVRNNVSIVTPDMMDANFALHIDKKTPPVFYPRMPKSAMASENDSCARVSVACTLLGCYIGYWRGESDITSLDNIKKNLKNGFAGGYTISKIPFTLALKPSTKLLPDAELSEELWLVAYDTGSREYKPTPIGKMFVSELTYMPRSGTYPDMMLTVWIENTEPEGMWLDRKNKLEVGHYKVILHWPDIFSRSIYNHNITIEKVSKSDFDSVKKLVANMLELPLEQIPSKPKYFSW